VQFTFITGKEPQNTHHREKPQALKSPNDNCYRLGGSSAEDGKFAFDEAIGCFHLNPRRAYFLFAS
jgi:hypothetical protein